MSGNTDWSTAIPGPLRGTTVWRADLALDEAGRRACIAVLSDDERARAARFVRREDHDRYAASHAALRTILAAALETDPAALRFRQDAHGKPELDGPWRDAVAFNLSHSGRIGLIGVSPNACIGVDVELLRAIPDCLALARGHFARAETEALARLPAAALQTAFYACWTRKEAFVKALGLGLSFPLDAFTVAVPPDPANLLSIGGSAEAARAWTLRHLDPAPDHLGAVAIEGPDHPYTLCSLDPGWTATAR